MKKKDLEKVIEEAFKKCGWSLPKLKEYLASTLIDKIEGENKELIGALESILGVFNLHLYSPDTGGGRCYIKAKRALAQAKPLKLNKSPKNFNKEKC